MFSNFTDGLGSLFSVKSPVTASTDVLSPDFLKTEDALTTMGHMDGTTPDIGEGLKNFQADRGLKVDGVMNPGGPTESALKKSLASHKSGTLPSHVTVEKNGEHGATASAAFASKPTPKVPEKIKQPSPIRIDPITGLQDPLAQPSVVPKKSNTEMAKVWDQHHQLQEARTTEDALQVLLGDELYQIKDPAYLNHVTKQFDRTFPGVAEHDETGKMVQPRPAIKPHEVEAYDPQGYLKQKKDVNSSVPTTDVGVGRSGLPNPRAVANAKEDLASQMQLDPAVLEEMEAYEVADDLLGEGYQVADASGDNLPYKSLSQEAVEHWVSEYKEILRSEDPVRAEAFRNALSSYHPNDRKRMEGAFYKGPKEAGKDVLSAAAIKEMGTHLARRTARAPYDKDRLKGTNQALYSAYEKEDQERIREYAKNNPQPVLPENHDVWRGNVAKMAEVMGLDKKLIDEAGNAAGPAMAAVMSYRNLESPEARYSALKAIQNLENAGYRKLAFTLRGELALSLVQPALVATSQSNAELKEQIQNHSDIERVSGFVGSLPKVPNGLLFISKGIEEGAKSSQRKADLELKRREKTR